MRLRLHLVTTVAALGLAAGCANARLRAERRKLPPPEKTAEEVKPEDVRPVWFTAEGKTDGRRTDAGDEAGPARRGPLSFERPPGRKEYPNSESPLGANLAPVGPDSRDWVFVDVFKMASPWALESQRSMRGPKTPEQDEDGWVLALSPTQAATTRLPTLNGGRFVVLYSGRGVLRVRGGRVLEERPGRLVYEAPARRTVTLVLEATNPSDHVRDIRVVPADFEGTYQDQVFHPLFLQRLSRFSVLRFTGWARAELAAAPTWSQRATPDWYTQGGPRGVAYEYMVMLANELGADMWISVPHRANDDHVAKLAGFLAERLDPDLKVYVEYGTAFDAPDSEPSRYAKKQGQFMGLDPDPTLAGAKYRVRRSMDVFDTFATRFDPRRTYRVLTGPLDDPERLRAILEYKRAAEKVDLLAVAAFVGVRVERPERARALAAMKPADVLDALEFTALPALMSEVREAQRVAAAHGVGLVAYSGGEDLTVQPGLPAANTLDRLFDRVSRDPRGAGLYAALLGGWADAGGELFVHAPLVSEYGRSGRTAAMEYQDQGPEAAPRYGALAAFADERPRWWGKRRRPAPDAPEERVAEAPTAPTDLAAEQAPESQERAVWAAGGAGLAAAAAGALFAGLYLRSVAARDRLVNDTPFLEDSAQGRALDDQAYGYSVAFATSFSLAAIGFGSAVVLDLFEEAGYDGANPGVVIGAGTGLVALTASATFLVAYLNTLGERDQRLDTNPNPTDPLPLRNLDDEAFRWSLASATALGVSVASFAVALAYYLVDQRDPYLDGYTPEAPAARSGVDVVFAPNGFVLKW